MKLRERLFRRLLRFFTERADSTAIPSTVQDALGFLTRHLAQHPASIQLIHGRWRVHWPQGVELYYTAKFNSITYHYLNTGHYEDTELRTFHANLKPDSVVCDIGANVGLYTLLATQILRTGKIFAFEPSPDTLRELRDNLALNCVAERVEIVPVALGDHCSTGFITSEFHSSNFLVDAEGSSAKEPVIITTLDEFVIERGLSRMDFIKMDIEGFELSALRGGIETLRRFQPMLLIELQEHPSDFHERAKADYRAVIELLTGFSYRYFVIDDAGEIVEGTDFKADPAGRSYHNYLFYIPEHHQPVFPKVEQTATIATAIHASPSDTGPSQSMNRPEA